MKTKKTKTITISITTAIILIAATVLYLNKKQDTTEENTNYLEISNIEDIKNKTKEIKDENKIPLYKEDSNFYNEQMIMPIISTSGDCIGSIVIVAKENEKFQEGTDKILKVACSFLGKQVQ